MFHGKCCKFFFFNPLQPSANFAVCLVFPEVPLHALEAHQHPRVQEVRARKTWLKHLCHNFRRSRTVGLIDSRVLLAASAKSRSSSAALCHVQQTELLFVLGGGLYTGGLHIYTSKNPSDGPSRNRPPARLSAGTTTPCLTCTWHHKVCRSWRRDGCVYCCSSGVTLSGIQALPLVCSAPPVVTALSL